jgi:hypothetical protein
MRTVLRFPDFILLGITLPIFILADWPLAGWAGAAVGWFVQAIVIGSMEQKALRSSEPRQQVGLVVGASLVRAWIAAAAILTTGLVFGDSAGLACALLSIALFTIYFANKMFFHLTRPVDKVQSTK